MLLIVGLHEHFFSPASNAFCLDTDNRSENPTGFVGSADYYGPGVKLCIQYIKLSLQRAHYDFLQSPGGVNPQTL